MRLRRNTVDCRGITLVEILIGIAILGVLLGIAWDMFRGLNERYRVEMETKRLYADLMDARGRAMQRNRMAFVELWGTRYATYEDTNTPPDGNGACDNTTDAVIASVSVSHSMIPTLSGGAGAFEFNRNGIASVTGDIRFSSTAQPDYDCITIRPTRIRMGRYIGGTCVEK